LQTCRPLPNVLWRSGCLLQAGPSLGRSRLWLRREGMQRLLVLQSDALATAANPHRHPRYRLHHPTALTAVSRVSCSTWRPLTPQGRSTEKTEGSSAIALVWLSSGAAGATDRREQDAPAGCGFCGAETFRVDMSSEIVGNFSCMQIAFLLRQVCDSFFARITPRTPGCAQPGYWHQRLRLPRPLLALLISNI